MKIALLTDGGNGKFGGADIYVSQLAKALYQLGFQPSIAAIYPGSAATEMYLRCKDFIESYHVVPNYSFESIFPKRRIFRPIRNKFIVDANSLPSWRMWAKVHSLMGWLTQLKPDVGHIHWAGGIPMGVIASRALLGCKIPIIETLHSAPPGFGDYGSELNRLRIASRRKIIAVSEATCRSLKNLYDGKSPSCTVLYCGVNERLFQQQAEMPPLDGEGMAVDISRYKSPRIVIVGHINEQKGVRVLIEAAHLLKQRNKEFSVWIIGEGGMRQTLAEKVIQLGLQDRIYFSGHVKNPAPWYKNADIFTQCSTESEGLPLSIYEAMALGVPVIATNIGGISEAIEDGKTGLLIPPKSPEALALALEKIIENPELKDMLSKNGRDLVNRSFSFHSSTNVYVSLYKEIVAAHSFASPLLADHRYL